MNYDWNKPLLPGTVVCANYYSFDNEPKVGIFIVLYDEQSDNFVFGDKNILGIKLSTKNTCVSNYAIEINTEYNSFLNDDCIACCSKIHVLHKKEQVYKVLGILNYGTYKQVFKTYNKFMQEVNRQLVTAL